MFYHLHTSEVEGFKEKLTLAPSIKDPTGFACPALRSLAKGSLELLGNKKQNCIEIDDDDDDDNNNNSNNVNY